MGPPEKQTLISNGGGFVFLSVTLSNGWYSRDQRIKRSRDSSFAYISIGLAGGKNECAIGCAIVFWYKVRICGPDFERFNPQKIGRNS